jgi:oxidoreductase AflX
MATYAVLGATGATGSAVIDALLRDPSKQVHAFCRSKQKLTSQRGELSSDDRIKVFEGHLSDVDVLAACLRDTRAAFLACGVSENLPNTTVAQDQARGVVAALSRLRDEHSDAKLPLVVVLSSSNVSPELCRDIPWLARAVLLRGASNIYADLRAAEAFLRGCAWVRQVYVKPGGLVVDAPRGHVLSTERQQTFLSYADLGGGMVEIADEEDPDRWDGRNVSVVPARPGTRIEWRVPWFMAQGLLCHYLPGVYIWLRSWLA